MLLTGAALVIPPDALRLGAAFVLFVFAAYLYLKRQRHPRGIGMRVGFRELTLWSFLMSSAHGAGLMLVRVSAPMHGHGGHDLHAASIGVLGVHTFAMFAAMTGVALAVFHFVGVDFLRRAWLNLDGVWVAALVVSGVVTLV